MKSLTSIEYLRAFSMLYIVAYWHLFDYSTASLGHHHPVMVTVTHVVLALFVFMSGFLLTNKNSGSLSAKLSSAKQTSTKQLSAKQFYLRRLLRIYPLYALAVVLFFLCGINDAWTSIKGLFGVSMFAAPAPLTLWFVTMLVLFYVMTPLLLRLVGKVWVYAGAVAGFLLFSVLVQLVFNSVDPRVMLYFPSFCLGIFCAHHGMSGTLINPWAALAGFAVAIGLAFVRFPIESLDYLVESVLVASAAYLVFYIGWRNESRFPKAAWVSLLSYSSYALYLFHRPVYTALKSVYFPEDPYAQVIYLLTLGLALAIAVAWSLQRGYDWLYQAVRVQPPGKVAT